MSCPECAGPVETGRVRIRSTLPSVLAVGLSVQHLWWFRDDGRREKLLKAGRLYEAYRCMRCGTLVVPARDRAR